LQNNLGTHPCVPFFISQGSLFWAFRGIIGIPMDATKKIKTVLDTKYRKIRETPASFAFFIAIHDFVQYIEATPKFCVFLGGSKARRSAEIPQKKYSLLTQIYQGIEDIEVKPAKDPGHSRYSVMRELGSIRNKDVSESNTFWKKREALRKLTAEIYSTLNVYLSENQHV
jgi:hypothetical protein